MLNNILSNPVSIDQARQKRVFERQLKDSKNPAWQAGHSAGIDTGMMIAHIELMEAVSLAGQGDREKLKEYVSKTKFPGGFLEAMAVSIVEGCRAMNGRPENENL